MAIVALTLLVQFNVDIYKLLAVLLSTQLSGIYDSCNACQCL